MLTIREGESVTALTIRKLRAEVLEEVRDRIMSLEPDTSATAEQHKVGFRAGHSQARYAARDLITEMLRK